MFKYFLALPMVAMAAPGMACYSTEKGDIYKFSNRDNIKVTDGGTATPTSDWPNYWSVKRAEGLAGTAFGFVINMDKERSGINGIKFAFHTAKPIVDWKVGDTETFSPYKSLGAESDELSYAYFSCGSKIAGGRKFHEGYFGSQVVDEKAASAFEGVWHLDARQSSATLTAVEDSYTSGPNEFSLNATMNLVYVKAESERWSDGGKIRQNGVQRKINISMDKVRFIREYRQTR